MVGLNCTNLERTDVQRERSFPQLHKFISFPEAISAYSQCSFFKSECMVKIIFIIVLENPSNIGKLAWQMSLTFIFIGSGKGISETREKHNITRNSDETLCLFLFRIAC